MKIFMSNYILKCRICSKLPENRVSWGKKSSFKGKNRVLGFWAKSSFPRNAQKKACIDNNFLFYFLNNAKNLSFQPEF